MIRKLSEFILPLFYLFFAGFVPSLSFGADAGLSMLKHISGGTVDPCASCIREELLRAMIDSTDSENSPISNLSPGTSAGLQIASLDSDILNYVNQDRKEHGLVPLKINALESAIAEQHSRNMADGKVAFGHGGFNNRVKAIRKALGEVRAVGENVASGALNARQVVDGWLNSPGHKRNIEGDFTLTGIGYAQDKKGDIFFTQIFSR